MYFTICITEDDAAWLIASLWFKTFFKQFYLYQAKRTKYEANGLPTVPQPLPSDAHIFDAWFLSVHISQSAKH